MIEEQELQALADYRGSAPVLSVYLDTDLAHKSKDAVRLEFREAVRHLQGAERQAQAVETYLDLEYDWQARGLAIFGSDEGLWQVVPLPIAVHTLAVLAERTYTRVLMDVRDRLGRYNVALIDRASLRLFSVAWGRIQAEAETFGEALKYHRQGGSAAAHYQRHTDNLALHNLKQAIELMQSFVEQSGTPRLILAGHGDVLTQVRELMPRPLADGLIGQFSADNEATPTDILSRSLEVAYEADLAEERRMVNEAITAAAKGGAGVMGLADTVSALYEGRVRLLLVEESLHVAGMVCSHCGHVALDPVEVCPLCQGRTWVTTPDVVGLALQKAGETGAEVNIVRANEELLRVGGMAAILRY